MKQYRNVTVFLFILVLLEVAVYLHGGHGSDVPLYDSDCYMRLLRVEQLHDTGQWYDSCIHRSNAPYGESSHWTRLLDILLLIGAYAGQPFVGFHSALWWWGVLISPVLYIISIVMLLWAAKPIFSTDSQFRLMVLALIQTGIYRYYLIGRPDHHSLLLLLFIVYLGCMVHALYSPSNRRYAWCGGLATAMGMWVSVETLAAVLMSMSSLSLLWLLQKPETVSYSRQAVRYFSALLCGCICFLFVERPIGQLFTMEYDTLSIVHIGVLFLLLLFWFCVRVAERSKQRFSPVLARFSLLILLAGISLVLLRWLCPVFLHGPFATIDPRIIPLWLDHVDEVQPLLPLTAKNIAHILLLLGPLFAVVPYMLYKFMRKRQEMGREWVLWLSGGIIFSVVTLQQVRWAAYAETILIFPYAALLAEILGRINAFFKRVQTQMVARVLALVLFYAGFILLASAVTPPAVRAGIAQETITAHADRCAVEFLNDPNGLGASPKIVLTDVDFGPEIMYYTHHSVVATGYHRNAAGILFFYDVMTAQQDATAYALLQQRKVDVILVPAGAPGKTDDFRNRLLKGQYPAWLRPLAVPPGMAGEMVAFVVVYHQ